MRFGGTRRPQRNWYKVVAGTLGAMLCVLVLRLFILQIIEGPALAEKAQQMRTNVITLHAKRGSIYDRNGNVIAMSVECKTLYANPSIIKNPSKVAKILVDNLGGDESDYMSILTQNNQFAYLKRQVDSDVAAKIMDELQEKKIEGVYQITDMKRIYPYGNVGIQIIGITDNDGKGLTGLESYYNDELTGTDGEMTLETGTDGTPIAGGISETTDAVNGHDIVIAIDINLQAKVEEALAGAPEKYDAADAQALVMNPKNGEILAIASTPLPDISDRNKIDGESLNLKPVSSVYEPGSVFKIFTTSIGLQNGSFKADSVFNIPPVVKVGDDMVKDSDQRDYYLAMDIREMLRRSSNTAMATLVQSVMGPETFAKGVQQFQIGALTGIDYPGDTAGIVKTYNQFDGSTAGQMSFGQGLAVSMVQMARGTSIVANGGQIVTPHFLMASDGKEAKWPTAQSFITKDVAAEETDMLRTVITKGDARTAQVEGYDIAGKTGTAQMVKDDGTYYDERYYSSLVGYANASDPQVLVYTGLIDTWHFSYYTAAPLFKQVMTDAVQTLAIPKAQ